MLTGKSGVISTVENTKSNQDQKDVRQIISGDSHDVQDIPTLREKQIEFLSGNMWAEGPYLSTVATYDIGKIL
jgi:hypothetical protein